MLDNVKARLSLQCDKCKNKPYDMKKCGVVLMCPTGSLLAECEQVEAMLGMIGTLLDEASIIDIPFLTLSRPAAEELAKLLRKDWSR